MGANVALNTLVAPMLACSCLIVAPNCTPRTKTVQSNYVYRQISKELDRSSRYNGVTIIWEENAVDSAQLQANLKRLKSFEAYEDNWNGYGAPKFTKTLLEAAEKILRGLNHQPEVFPIDGGVIQFEYEKQSGEYLEFEVSENKNAHCLRIDENGVEQEFDVAVEEINKVVDAFYGHSVLRN